MQQLVESLHEAQPTYDDIGATLDGVRPQGFHHDRYETSLGHGSQTFQRAVNGLRTWEAHHVPGVRVFPKQQDIEIGATVVVTLGTPLLALVAPCRIVSVVDIRPDGALLTGRCQAILNRERKRSSSRSHRTRVVRFEIVAFSRPGDPLVRLSGPIGRGIQKSGTNGYLRALRRYVDQKAQIDG